VAGSARAAETAAGRAGAARNDLQRIDGDLALLRGQTTALREAAERADSELAARDAGAAMPALPSGFKWLHERISVPAEVTLALGESIASVDSKEAKDLPAPKGTRRAADGLAIFVAPDDATAIAAAAGLRGGVVVSPSGLIVLPGLVRHADQRRKADHDARTQLRGMSGYLLVIDGTRRATLDTAMALQTLATEVVGDVPFVVLLNKSDLTSTWDIDDAGVFKMAERGWRVLRSSAKTGEGVEEAFEVLTRAMLVDAPAQR